MDVLNTSLGSSFKPLSRLTTMAALMTETDQPCSSTKTVSLPLVGFSFAHLYLRAALQLNI